MLSFTDSFSGYQTPLPLSMIAKAVGKVNIIVQTSCKDKNRTALTSDIVGAAIIEIRH